MNHRLMHCLSSSAGFALSLSPRVMALSAFFFLGAHANAAPPEASPKANAERGLAVYGAKCGACHSADEHRVGPAHVGVFGRRAGQARGYEYSQALASSKVIWTTQSLNAWLTNPEQVIPGQRMGYRLSLPQERADVVAYLATLRAPTPQNKK